MQTLRAPTPIQCSLSSAMLRTETPTSTAQKSVYASSDAKTARLSRSPCAPDWAAYNTRRSYRMDDMRMTPANPTKAVAATRGNKTPYPAPAATPIARPAMIQHNPTVITEAEKAMKYKKRWGSAFGKIIAEKMSAFGFKSVVTNKFGRLTNVPGRSTRGPRNHSLAAIQMR